MDDSSGSTASSPPPSADLSVIASRAAYIDANLTQILDTTPKQFSYLHHADANSQLPQSISVERLQRRVEALERENRRWADQYQLAAKQNQSLQTYIQQQTQPPPSASVPCSSAADPPPSTPPPPALHPRDSLFHALLTENGALLERYDSLQRRCRMQEQMIDTRNQALQEFMRAFTHQRQRERTRNSAAAPQAVAQPRSAAESEGQAAVGTSALHSRQLSVESNASDRSVEQQLVVDSIDALLTRPPRLFLSSSASSTSSSPPPESHHHSEEEVKQADEDPASHTFSRSLPSSRISQPPTRPPPPKPTSLSRRLQKPTLTVSAAKPTPSTARLVPHSPSSPRSRSPPIARSAISAMSSTFSTSPSSERARSSSAASAMRPPSRSPPARPTAPSLRPPSGSAAGGGGGKASPVPVSPRSPRSPKLTVVAEVAGSKVGGRPTSASRSATTPHSAVAKARTAGHSANAAHAAAEKTTQPPSHP